MNYVKDGLKTFFLFIVSTLVAYIYFHLSGFITNVAIIYILYVFLVARITSGYLWGIIASITGILGVNYIFTYPYLAFNFTLSGYPITFIGMLTIALITSTLTAHDKEQTKITALREACLERLHEINKQLITADSIPQVIQLTLDYVVSTAGISCIFYTDDPINQVEPISMLTKPEDGTIFSSDYEQAIAHLCYVSQNPSGLDFTVSDSKCAYFPVISHHRLWGILGFVTYENPLFIKENLNFFTLMLPQMALAIERQTLVDEHQELAIESAKEKMRGNLLRAISHDLRTPLTSMIGASSAYIESQHQLTEEEKTEFIVNIREDANWLLHMVENLLSVTRIIKESSKVIKKTELLEEVISEASSRVKKRYPNASINISIPTELIIVPMDATLIEQVIINLIENALKHSQNSKPIEVQAFKENNSIRIDVIDDGIGIPKEKLMTIFDGSLPNSSPSSDATKGIGIGLSICKTIISAHSGTITAKNLEKGTVFTFTLPLEEDH